MKEKILALIVIGLMVFGGIGSFGFYFVKAQSFSEGQVVYDATENEIFKEIAETEDKVLVADKIIGDRYVKYWEHVIDDALVKNDSILLHLDIETGDRLEYEKSWTDVEIVLPDYRDKIFEPVDYLWKQKVVFPDEDDSGIFCTFYISVDYPLVCWEVRYIDGTTILYNLNGERIGREVQAPTVGLAIQGQGEPDWRLWRENAQEWYGKWCHHCNSKSSPSNSWISNFLKMPDCSYFYVIAHSDGLPTRFRSSGPGVHYTASLLHEDMKDRSPYKLAVLSCCSAMEDTGPGTLSYEFRKGQMTDTVTIGYYDMGNCSGWPWDVLDWQDHMFYLMDRGYKMKEAFDVACANYPTVADYVRFVGDENIKVRNAPPETYIYVHGPYGSYIGPYTIVDPPKPNKHDLELEGKVGKTYTFKATAPIIYPSWPDTNDPDPDGGIVDYQWERTGDGEYNVDSDETTSNSVPVNGENQQSSQSQRQGASPAGGLEGNFIEVGGIIEPVEFSWSEEGTYEATLTVTDNEGVSSSTTIIMHITSGDSSANQNSESSQQSSNSLFLRLLLERFPNAFPLLGQLLGFNLLEL
jgi:hypothetical protein